MYNTLSDHLKTTTTLQVRTYAPLLQPMRVRAAQHPKPRQDSRAAGVFLGHGTPSGRGPVAIEQSSIDSSSIVQCAQSTSPAIQQAMQPHTATARGSWPASTCLTSVFTSVGLLCTLLPFVVHDVPYYSTYVPP